MASTLVAQGVAGQGLLQLCNCADVAGMQFVDRDRRLALHDRKMSELFRAATIEVLQARVVLQHARINLEEGDASGERIADGLEHEQRERLRVADLADRGLAIVGGGSGFHFATLDRRRHVIHDEVEHLVGADVAQA